jgi:hypothetical protein
MLEGTRDRSNKECGAECEFVIDSQPWRQGLEIDAIGVIAGHPGRAQKCRQSLFDVMQARGHSAKGAIVKAVYYTEADDNAQRQAADKNLFDVRISYR